MSAFEESLRCFQVLCFVPKRKGTQKSWCQVAKSVSIIGLDRPLKTFCPTRQFLLGLSPFCVEYDLWSYLFYNNTINTAFLCVMIKEYLISEFSKYTINLFIQTLKEKGSKFQEVSFYLFTLINTSQRSVNNNKRRHLFINIKLHKYNILISLLLNVYILNVFIHITFIVFNSMSIFMWVYAHK